MSDYTVRVLRPDETRTASTVFRGAMHMPQLKDEDWEVSQRLYQPGRTFGVFDTELIGTARSFDAELLVPGGRRMPLAAVTGVGVRPDRVRRGVLSQLMRAQLTDFAARGTTFAALYASEAAIYGRFGYGAATVVQNVDVDRRRAVLRPEVPAGGEIELVSQETFAERMPAVYAAVAPSRPGMMTRPPYWWPLAELRRRWSDVPPVAIVHRGQSGPDGFLIYQVDRKHWNRPSTLDVLDLVAADDAAFAGLWRYLLGIDLVDTIKLGGRPLDEPTPLLFTDPRRCALTGGNDGLWLRLVDVPAALAARGYEGEPVVIEVADPVLEDNSGRYRVSPDGVERTDRPADLRLGVEALAMLYLGTWRASALATAGRVHAADESALTRAHRLFATGTAAWCGTSF